ESGRHRRHVLHADRERARAGDSRHLASAHGAGVPGHRVRAAPDAAAVALVRSPCDRRRRRHPLPAVGRPGPRAAVPARSSGIVLGPRKRTKSGEWVFRVFVLSWRFCMTSSQLVVVGGGPGGYAAGFLGAGLGLSVALVAPEANPGGVCVYRGCIPSKALLHVANLIDESRQAKAWGVEFGEPR